jgi:cell division septation protein DedD
MDQIMPLEQRQKGLALAKAMVGGKKASKPTLATEKQAAAKAPAAKASPAKPAPAPPVAARGNWRIQLGAFGQKSSAEALFAKLSAKLAGRQGYYVAAGKVTRLQAGPFESRAAASAACARLAPQACFPVEAR